MKGKNLSSWKDIRIVAVQTSNQTKGWLDRFYKTFKYSSCKSQKTVNTPLSKMRLTSQNKMPLQWNKMSSQTKADRRI